MTYFSGRLILLLIWPAISALLFKIRGGLWGDFFKKHIPFWGTTFTRIFWASLTLLPVATVGTYPYFCMVPLQYLTVIFGWGRWQNQKDLPRDTIFMSLRGLLLTVPPGLILVHFVQDSGLLYAFCGIFMGPCYLAGKYIYIWIHKNPQVYDASEWGEGIFGAVLGIFLVLSLKL